MSWDSPLPTKLFLGAAAVVLLAGWVVVFRDRTPMLSAPQKVPTEFRDAVASPALPMAAGGWFQAAALSRAAQIPARLSPTQALLPRATAGRTAFSAPRVIVDHVKRGVPEPSVSSR